MQNTNGSPELPARTHSGTPLALFRRPFAPVGIGFLATTKVPG